MMKVDEWKHRYTGPRSAFQLSENAKMQEDIFATPSYRKILVPDQGHILTSGERKAKRRRIMTLAEQISEGQPLSLLSVTPSGGSLSNTVARVLRDRGEQWPKRERPSKNAPIWADVDDHMTTLRKARTSRQIEESPAVVEEPLLDATKPTTNAHQQHIHTHTIEPTEDFIHLPGPPNLDPSSGRPPSHTATHSSSSPHRSKGKKSKENTDIRQRLLTKSFKGSRLVSEEEIKAEEPDKATRTVHVESPFVYHKKKPAQKTEGSTAGLNLVEQHLNKVLPISPESGKTSASLRKSLVHEMRKSGADLTSIDEPQKRPGGETQWPGTQALIDKAQVALFSTPSKPSPHRSKVPHTDKPADQALTIHRTSPADAPVQADTQAILNAWSPWSAARRGIVTSPAAGTGTLPDEVSGSVKVTSPAKKKDSLDWSNSNGENSFTHIFDMPSVPQESTANGYDDHTERSMEETEIMINDDSSFQAAQDVSFGKLLTESQLGRDISDVAQNVLV